MNYQDEYFKRKQLEQQTGVKDLSGPTPQSAYKGMDRSEYESKIAARNKAEVSGTPVAEKAEGMNSAVAAQGTQAATAAAAQGNGMGTLGGGMMAAGAIPSPASPYLIGAGLGLQVLGAAEQNKRQKEEAQRQAYNDRIAKRQQIMQQIASQGIQ